MFDSEFFSRNRTELRKRIGEDIPIVITANGIIQRTGDEPLPFHQESNFWYLTGINGPELTLVMLGDDSYIIVPGMSPVREAFEGAHDLKAYAERSGITDFALEREGWKKLRKMLQKTGVVATLASPHAYLRSHGLHTLPYRRRLIDKIKRTQPGITVRDIRPDLASMRSIKKPEELRAIQQAIDITCRTLEEVAAKSMKEASWEYELEAALTYGFRRRAADGHAFSPVVGAGSHSTTLHHFENNSPIRDDDLIVLDVGAEVEHYAADICRTVSKTPITGRRAIVFNAVASTQDYALSLIKPGVMPREYERAVEAFIGERLLELGVITEKTRANIRQYFPHATSHFLGIDTHDVGDYEAPWQIDMVITCEPGIYLPEENFGVRIEDDVRITENGCEVLSKSCPRALTSVQ